MDADPCEALRTAPLPPCLLLHGEETFLVERALAVVRARLAAERPPTTWTTAWADQDAARLPAALAELRAPLLFGGVPGLVIRRAEALPVPVEDQLLQAVGVPGAGRVVLVGRTMDQRRKLVASLMRAGAARAFARPADDAAVRRWVSRMAQDAGGAIAPAAVDVLLARCGSDLAQLSGEIEKAALWAGAGARIEVAAVEATVAGTRSEAVEELTERLARGDLAGASRTLRGLLSSGEPPIKLAAFLAANLRRALHVAELAECGLGPEAVAERLGMPAWLVRKQLGRGRARDLEAALDAMRRLDVALKSSRPPAAAFEATLLEVARATTAPRRAAR